MFPDYESFTSLIENELCIYITDLYSNTGDTVIFAESVDNLQSALNEFESYCKEWKLNGNKDKTRVLIFSQGTNVLKRFYFHNRDSENVK